MKIYVANYGPHMNDSLKKLEDEGNELIKLTEGNVDVFGTDRLRYNIETILKETEAGKDDLIILSGSPVIVAIATNLMKQMTGKLNIMIYGAKYKDYVKREDVV